MSKQSNQKYRKELEKESQKKVNHNATNSNVDLPNHDEYNHRIFDDSSNGTNKEHTN